MNIGHLIQAVLSSDTAIKGYQSVAHAAVAKELSELAELGNTVAAETVAKMSTGAYDKEIEEASESMSVTDLADMLMNMNNVKASIRATSENPHDPEQGRDVKKAKGDYGTPEYTTNREKWAKDVENARSSGDSGSKDPTVIENLYDFLEDHVEHFGVLPGEYEAPDGAVYTLDEYSELIPNDEWALLMQKVRASIKATPSNDDLVTQDNPNLKMPVVELDPAPIERPELHRKDETLRLNEKGVGTITQTDIIN